MPREKAKMVLVVFESGKHTLYESMGKAAESLNVKHSTVKDRTNRGIISRGEMKYTLWMQSYEFENSYVSAIATIWKETRQLLNNLNTKHKGEKNSA